MRALAAAISFLPLSAGSAAAAQLDSCPAAQGRNYSGQNLTDHKSDFTDAIFQNVSPSTFSVNNVDITNALLGCTTLNTPGCKNFSGLDLTGANLTDVNLTGANRFQAKLDHAANEWHYFKNAKLNYATLTCARFYGSAQTAPPVARNVSLRVETFLTF